MTPEEITKNADLQKVVDQGKKIYEEIRGQYEPSYNGKFLAIDIDSRKTYMADTSVDAMLKARTEHPKKVFYMVKIGYDAVETITNFFLAK
jgi:hypothetical protein